MPTQELRAYIAALEKAGEVQRIEKEVDWDLEVGAIIRRVYDLRAPAPFFQSIRGYSPGYRILGAPLGFSKRSNSTHARLALVLGMRPDSSVIEIMEEYISRLKSPIKPTMVSGGPCKEHIHLGNDVDLEQFPAPLLHGGDGGRYLGTWHTVVAKDPDTDWVNWGMYRLMLQDKKTLGILLSPPQHIGQIYYPKYEARNRSMEVAIAIGTHPACAVVSAMGIGAGVNEVDIVGGLLGEPVELVKCETVDLAVPASSEIVIEGEVCPYERMEEGPFGEYTGYMGGERAPRPVIRVKAITHREDPILTCACPGVPVEEDHALRPLASAHLLNELRSRGFPVRMVYIPPEVGNHLYAISTKVPFPGYAKYLASAVWGSSHGKSAFFLVILDDDVDVTNLSEVMWAFASRCHPDRGIIKMSGTWGHPLLAFTSREEKRHNLAAQVLFDCTWPKEWPKEAIPIKASFDVMWPKHIQDRVVTNWQDYGFE